MRISKLLVMLAFVTVFYSVAYAYIPGYQYYIPIEVNNPNPYALYKYPIIFDLNLQPYTLSDYNDIRVEYLSTDHERIELNYSKEVLPNGLVRLYVYMDRVPASTLIELRVYVGKAGDTDHSIPVDDAIGEYLAIRFYDGPLGGSTWTPRWSEIRSCTDDVWEDGGRDAFDNFLYPQLFSGESSFYLRASPYASCNPYYTSLGGVHYKYENYAFGYDPNKESAPHNPGAKRQRVWAQEILPRCDARSREVSIKYKIRGNLGSDSWTHYWDYNVTLPFGITVAYHQTNDETTPTGTSGDPQIHYFVLAGDGSQHETFHVYGDNVNHIIEYNGIPTAITYLLFVGDVHGHVGDWISSNAYIGEPCYTDYPLDLNVGEPVENHYLSVEIPPTIYRTHEYNVSIYYDGNEQITLVTDWGYEANAIPLDDNYYYATLYADENVSVGTHTVDVYVGDILEMSDTTYVDYGGTVAITDMQYQPSPMTGVLYTLRVTISCYQDICGTVAAYAQSDGCVLMDSEKVLHNIPPGETNDIYFKYVCYNSGDYNITVDISSALSEERRTITVHPYLQNTATTAQISAPDVVDPNAEVYITVSTTNYEGNVTVSLLDSDFNPIVITEATPAGAGVYYATLTLPSVPDGQYYLLAAGDGFSVARVLVVSSFAFMNPYGILVEDEYGKPASIISADVNGTDLTYMIKLLNVRNTPFTAYTDEWLSNGGILQLPAEFMDVIDTLSVTNTDGTVQYTVDYTISGGAISVVWSTDTHTLTLAPGGNIYKVTVKSPYVERLQTLYDATADPAIYNYLQQALEANYAYEQAKIYYTAMQYIQGAMYGGITVDVAIPPSVIQAQTAYGFVYISNSAGYIDPTTMSCEIVDEVGNTIGTCTLTKVDDGIYKVQLYTDSTGIYGIKVSASAGLFASQGVAYYQVTSQYQPGEITVTNFVVPPDGTTTVIYAQDPAATVQIFMYDSAGTLIQSGVATYDSSIGAFVYDLNVGDVTPGDYVIVASDNFGYSDRAIIHVSPILEDILASISDINTFLMTVIEPKLDTLDTKVDQILDGQQNLYAAVEEVNANTTQIISLIDQIEQNIDTQHAETVAYLQELNTTAHQILQEVLYIKQRIDDVVIVKLDQILTNQQDMNATLTDIESMIDCNTPSAVCLQLQAIRLSIEDLNDTITANHEEVVNNLSTIESKVDTLQTYVSNVKELLECNTPYPSTSVCARLDTLQTQVDSIDDEITDMNAFLNQIYDYVRNDLTNEVISVGHKVEDLNNYLHGDVWNKLVDIHQKVNGLYSETNDIKTLIQGHDAIVQAQLDALMNYLSDVNATLYQRIEQMQTTILSRLDTVSADTNDILDNTNTLLDYFMCTQSNEVCDSLNDIKQLAEEINATNYEIISDVNSVRALTLSGFDQVNERLDAIESNVDTLRNLLECQQYPQSSVCARLDSILEDTNNIKTSIADLNEEILDLYHEVQEEIDAVHTMAGGGGGGGPSAITPIKVAYKAGQVFVAVPEYVPPGTYEVQYSGSLYRFVKKPAPGDEIELKNGIIELELMPGASGVISGEIRLIRGTRTYIIRVDLVADDRLNQIVSVHPTDGTIHVSIPEGGATVIVKGPLANCVPSKRFYFAKEGTYEIKKTCDADGVLEVIPNSLHQASIQISVSQKPQSIVQAQDIVHTTVLPMAAFFVLAAIVSWLGLL